MNESIDIICKTYAKYLTNKKRHTSFKIKYVKSYIKNWLFVFSNNQNTKHINFIDCMCNAGVYADGEYCTGVEILSLFCEFAKKYQDKQYNLYLNDINSKSIGIYKSVINIIFPVIPNNVNIVFDCLDVNKYLYSINAKYDTFPFGSAIFLYVDPYNVGAVNIESMVNFINSNYCELLYNFSTNDYIRNSKQSEKAKLALNTDEQFNTVEELTSYVLTKLETGKIKYSLVFPFKNKTNVEIYRLLYLTPKETGIDKIKDAIWNVFNGSSVYQDRLIRKDYELSLFDDDEIACLSINQYANDCKKYIIDNWGGRVVHYNVIKDYVNRNSLLKDTHIINHIIKPMINDSLLAKQNHCNKNNYKGDSYLVRKNETN